MKSPDAKAFAMLEKDLLAVMEASRELGLSTAVELLELALAEVRDPQAGGAAPDLPGRWKVREAAAAVSVARRAGAFSEHGLEARPAASRYMPPSACEISGMTSRS